MRRAGASPTVPTRNPRQEGVLSDFTQKLVVLLTMACFLGAAVFFMLASLRNRRKGQTGVAPPESGEIVPPEGVTARGSPITSTGPQNSSPSMTGESYAAIAVAAAALNPKTGPPTPLQKATIDYTGEDTNVQPGRPIQLLLWLGRRKSRINLRVSLFEN